MNPLKPTVLLPVLRTVSVERLDADWSGMSGVLGIYQSVQGWNSFRDLRRNIITFTVYINHILLGKQDARYLAPTLSTSWQLKHQSIFGNLKD